MIRLVQQNNINEWLRLRKLLYTDCSEKQLLNEIHRIINNQYPNVNDWVVYVYERNNKNLGGIIEATIHPNKEWCDTSPIGFIETLYVDIDLRKRGIATELVKAAEKWALKYGCREMAVDTDHYREKNILIYKALGYEMIEYKNKDNNICFKKYIKKF